jgi:carboxyl-terminal processing protease
MRTYGKGTVQQLIPLQAGKSTLKLTWAGFWRPSGRNIHRSKDAGADEIWGVLPDSGLEVALSPEQYDLYAKYRTARDLAGLEPLAEAMQDERGGGAAPADFVDRPLAKAVEVLQARRGANE